MRSVSDMVSSAMNRLTGGSSKTAVLESKAPEIGSEPALVPAPAQEKPVIMDPQTAMTLSRRDSDFGRLSSGLNPSYVNPMGVNPMGIMPGMGFPGMPLMCYTAFSHRTSESGVRQTQFTGNAPMGMFNPSHKRETLLPNGVTISETTTSSPGGLFLLGMYDGFGMMRPQALPSQTYTIVARDANGGVFTGKLEDGAIIVPDAQGNEIRLNPETLDFSVQSPRVRYNSGETRDFQHNVRADGSMSGLVDEKSTFTTHTGPDPLREGETLSRAVPASHSFEQYAIASDGSLDAKSVVDTFKPDGTLLDRTSTPLSTPGSRDLPVTRENVRQYREYYQASELQLARNATGEKPAESVGQDGTTYLAYPNHGTIIAVDHKGESHGIHNNGVEGYISAPAVDDKSQTLYAVGKDNRLYALPMDGGQARWSVDLKGTPQDGNTATYGTTVQSNNITPDGSPVQVTLSSRSVQVFSHVDGHPVVYSFDPASGEQVNARRLPTR